MVHFLPQFAHPYQQLFQRHAVLHIYKYAHARAVDQRLDSLAADLESDRTLQPSVGEIDIAELLLRKGSLDQQLHAYILE